jgi:GNAT superfamily N-acetyltransferase
VLARGMHEVSLEASADIPGDEDDEPQSFEHWLAHTMGGSGDKPEATFVALAGDEVIGYAKFSLTEAQPTTAHHDLTGVKRAWRGRGVARALKATQIAWAKANGYEQLRTRNEERNVPIRRLNEQFGYKPTVGRIYLRGPLA